jgi:hypothetical protein
MYIKEKHTTCVVEFWFGSIFVALVSSDYHKWRTAVFQPVSSDIVPYQVNYPNKLQYLENAYCFFFF